MRKACQSIGLQLGVLLCSTSLPVFAQVTPPPTTASTAGTGGLEEIVVTARRRSENLEDVPATIDALSAATLIERGIQTESDLQSAVPGLILRSANTGYQIDYVIRGEAQEPYSGSPPGVQPYVDDVALSGSYGASLYDLESVQVLKGPQGTLFGRNSTGGAVLYQTAQPGTELGGYVSAQYGAAQYGNFNKVVTEAALDVPVIPDGLLVRFSGTYQSGGAFVRNLYDNSMLGNLDVRSGRITLKATPGDQITNTTMVQYTNSGGTSEGTFQFFAEPCGGVGANFPCWANSSNPFFQSLVSSPKGTYFPGWPNGYVYPGGLPTLTAFLKSVGPYVVDNNHGSPYLFDDTTVVNTTTWELSDAATIKNIFGYDRIHLQEGVDNDGTPYPFLEGGGNTPGGSNLEQRITQDTSDELQLQGKVNRLTYLVGFFYADSITDYNSPITGFGYIPAFNVPYTFALRYKVNTEDVSYAVFTQETYAVTDRLNLTGGLRGTSDRISAAQQQYSAFYGLPNNHTTESLPSWTVTADYRFTPELMAYATTRGSWRRGGYNPFVAPVAAERETAADGGNYIPPETVRDVEMGFKYSGRIGNMPFRLNVDVFNAWYQDIEKTGATVLNGNITSTTLSIPSGLVRGVEWDGDIRPTDWLTFGSTFSFDDAQYVDNQAVIFGQTDSFGPFSDTPRYSGTLYAEVTQPLSSGALKYHADAFGETSFHITSLGNTYEPGDKLPGYVLLNLRADWSGTFGAAGLTTSLFMKNVLNTYYYTGGGGGVQTFGTNNANFGLPRTFGIAVRYDFKNSSK